MHCVGKGTLRHEPERAVEEHAAHSVHARLRGEPTLPVMVGPLLGLALDYRDACITLAHPTTIRPGAVGKVTAASPGRLRSDIRIQHIDEDVVDGERCVTDV